MFLLNYIKQFMSYHVVTEKKLRPL